MTSQCSLHGAISCCEAPFPANFISTANSKPAALGPNTTAACCPELTVCAPNFQHTEKIVRCQVQLNQLPTSPLFSSSSTSSSTTSSSIASSSQSTFSSTNPARIEATSLSNTVFPTPTLNQTAPSGSGSSATATDATRGLSNAAIAGISLGPTLALLVGFGFWHFLRQPKRVMQPGPDGDVQRLEVSASPHFTSSPAHTAYPPPIQELGPYRPHELE